MKKWPVKKATAGGRPAELPRGPVLCSPESLFGGSMDRVRHQEVFKMTALRSLKLLFPADTNPLYAGFGHTVQDMVAYKKMDVPEGRIFTINHRGELHNINHTYRQTYLSLSKQVDVTFPPLPRGLDGDWGWGAGTWGKVNGDLGTGKAVGGGTREGNGEGEGAEASQDGGSAYQPRSEPCFFPNRVAVEDRFTDLNFWRDTPQLVGDEDSDYEEDLSHH
ncbi:unnamed protein product [Discosporangium mesarthrocarpum]